VNRPSFTLIAGANVAGKSTLTSGNPSTFASIPVLDPDTFAKTIRSSGTTISPIAAGREVLRLTEEHLKQRQSFAVKTTLSGKNYLRLMRYARDISRGFEVTLIYIGTGNVEINLARIAERVRAGGHNVPEVDIRRRYLRSLENLPVAAKNADHVLLFDNSHQQGYQLGAYYPAPSPNGSRRCLRGSRNSKRRSFSTATDRNAAGSVRPNSSLNSNGALRFRRPAIREFVDKRDRHFSESAFDFWIEIHPLNGMPLRVYSPAETVADCFKFRSKFGTETAIQALRRNLPRKEGHDG
jgi:predicted ABC-type ATPase